MEAHEFPLDQKSVQTLHPILKVVSGVRDNHPLDLAAGPTVEVVNHGQTMVPTGPGQDRPTHEEAEHREELDGLRPPDPGETHDLH